MSNGRCETVHVRLDADSRKYIVTQPLATLGRELPPVAADCCSPSCRQNAG